MHATIANTAAGAAASNKPFLSDDDRNELVTAATSVLLRRDMSLNRRLYSWLLGGKTLDPINKMHYVCMMKPYETLRGFTSSELFVD